MNLKETATLTVIFFMLFGLGAKALQQANDTADVMACKVNVKTLAEGVVKYEETQGYLPPLKVIGSTLPGWNVRILPFIGHAAAHEQIVAAELYTHNPTIPEDYKTRMDKWTTVFDTLATVPEYRCLQRHPNATIKTNTYAGPTTDYATPLIWTNFRDRNVTLTYSLYTVESPLKIYELNPKDNTWRSVRKSSDWGAGTSNTLLISEKYIPDWAVTEDSKEANIFNGGLHLHGTGHNIVASNNMTASDRQTYLPQSSAGCYLTATHPIVQDGETPITKETTLHSRMVFTQNEPNSYDFHGNYAWGSAHAEVIVAAMGDGSVRSLNKDMNAYAFYQLTASNILPDPTPQERALAEEEARAIANLAQRQHETAIATVEADTATLAQLTEESESATQTAADAAIALVTAEAELVAATEAKTAAAVAVRQRSEGSAATLTATTERVALALTAVEKARSIAEAADKAAATALEKKNAAELKATASAKRLDEIEKILEPPATEE